MTTQEENAATSPIPRYRAVLHCWSFEAKPKQFSSVYEKTCVEWANKVLSMLTKDERRDARVVIYENKEEVDMTITMTEKECNEFKANEKPVSM